MQMIFPWLWLTWLVQLSFGVGVILMLLNTTLMALSFLYSYICVYFDCLLPLGWSILPRCSNSCSYLCVMIYWFDAYRVWIYDATVWFTWSKRASFHWNPWTTSFLLIFFPHKLLSYSTFSFISPYMLKSTILRSLEALFTTYVHTCPWSSLTNIAQPGSLNVSLTADYDPLHSVLNKGSSRLPRP
jgi:hypothetical protein